MTRPRKQPVGGAQGTEDDLESTSAAAATAGSDWQSLPSGVLSMMRMLRDISETFPEEHADIVVESLPKEAKGVLNYIIQCCKGAAPKMLGSNVNIQDWVQTCLEFERGRRYLGIPDVCLPCPLPPSVDYVAELSHCSPQLFDAYCEGEGQGTLEEVVVFDAYCEDLMRLVMYGGAPGQLDRSPSLGLLKWRSPEAAAAWSQPLQLPPCCLLPTSTARKELMPHDPQGMPWDSRLSSTLQQASRSLPWFSRSAHSGVILAGGAAVGMVARGAKPSDHDLFLVVPSVDSSGMPLSPEARAAAGWSLVQEVLEALRREVAMMGSKLHLYVSCWHGVVDVLVLRQPLTDAADGRLGPDVLNGRSIVFKGQIIPRLYESPAQVVHGFDVDACAVLFDGEEVWAATRAVRALHQGFLLAEPIRQSPSYELRLEKYSRRLGLDVLVPGMHPMLQDQAAEDVAKISARVTESLSWMSRVSSREMQHAKTRSLHSAMRKFMSKQSGLARLLALRMAAEEGLSTKLLCERENNYSWGGDSTYEPQQDSVTIKALVGLLFGACTWELNARTTDADYERLQKEVSFITVAPHLQSGHEPLFSGSFNHSPLNNWYHCAVSKAHERFMQGTVDLEVSAGAWEEKTSKARQQVGGPRGAGALSTGTSQEQKLVSPSGVGGSGGSGSIPPAAAGAAFAAAALLQQPPSMLQALMQGGMGTQPMALSAAGEAAAAAQAAMPAAAAAAMQPDNPFHTLLASSSSPETPPALLPWQQLAAPSPSPWVAALASAFSPGSMSLDTAQQQQQQFLAATRTLLSDLLTKGIALGLEVPFLAQVLAVDTTSAAGSSSRAAAAVLGSSIAARTSGGFGRAVALHW